MSSFHTMNLEFQRDAARKNLRSSLAGVLGDLSFDLLQPGQQEEHHTQQQLLATHSSQGSATATTSTTTSNALLARTLGFSPPAPQGASTQQVPNQLLNQEDPLKSSSYAHCQQQKQQQQLSQNDSSPFAAASLLLQGMGLPRRNATEGLGFAAQQEAGSLSQSTTSASTTQAEVDQLLGLMKANLLQDYIAQEKARLMKEAYLKLQLMQYQQQQQEFQKTQSLLAARDAFASCESSASHLLQALQQQQQQSNTSSSSMSDLLQHSSSQPVLPKSSLDFLKSAASSASLQQLLPRCTGLAPPQAQDVSFSSTSSASTSSGTGNNGVGQQLAQPQQQQPNARQVADAIGCQLRTGQPYIDVTALPGLEDTGVVAPRNRGGVTESFPEKLHRMLQETAGENDEEDTTEENKGKGEGASLSGIVSFLPHGRAFRVHDSDAFVEKILPKYFKQSKWNSFARQLNLYGFLRVTSGPDTGAYYHELFLKGRPTLCLHMRRVGVPQQQLYGDRRKFKTRPLPADQAPDFYAMKPMA